ncbi:MAG: hypothetical protein IJ181_00700, partial [Acidaminococcaceae bacterium]|nr:hypothetical protein [Acidaminococcaceae bacterium]
KGEDRAGNNTDPTGKSIDSPEQKQTVPDFFTLFQTCKSQQIDKEIYARIPEKMARQSAGGNPRLANNYGMKIGSFRMLPLLLFGACFPLGGGTGGGITFRFRYVVERFPPYNE